MSSPRQTIIDHYTRNPPWEKDRLTMDAMGQLEWERTLAVMAQVLPPRGTIVDCGGGPGSYTLHLAKQGYDVTLVDLVPDHVETARSRLADAHLNARCIVGSATALPLESESADAFLLMGPLYHLSDADDRNRALSEAHRVLKPNGGVLVAAAISRFASLFDGIRREMVFEPQFEAVVREDLASGHHANPDPARTDWFTEAFFTTPEQLRDEVWRAGFSVSVVACEGPVWIGDMEKNWGDAKRRALLLELAAKVEREPSILGMSPHLLALGHKT